MLNSEKELSPDYQRIAEFRYQIRRYLRFTEQVARGAGLEPQQHQLLLAVKGLPQGKKATVGVLAERLQIQHHSAVELIDRLEGRKLIRRYRSRVDRRRVFVRLTASGEQLLREISLYNLQELQSVAPSVVRILNELLAGLNDPSTGRSPSRDEEEPADLPERKKAGV